MIVRVDLFADLRNFAEEPSFEVALESGATVKELLLRLGIPEDLPMLVVVNEMMSSLDAILKDGDNVGLFPPMGGGAGWL